MLARTYLALAVAAACLAVAPPASADAPVKRYANCTALTAAYPAGVATSRAAASRAVRDGMRRPAVNATVYAQNKGSDRDHDGVACEQSA